VGGSGFYDAQFFPECTDPVEHAVLWEKGEILDLNNFVPPGSDLILAEAVFINDRGEIVSFGVLANGDVHAFLLIPCEEGTDGCADGSASATASRQDNSTLTIPQRLAIRRVAAGSRALLTQRYHIPGIGMPKD
jgi:hypothetical protein